jgi:caffeoyl-CoA O-methyltransferase
MNTPHSPAQRLREATSKPVASVWRGVSSAGRGSNRKSGFIEPDILRYTAAYSTPPEPVLAALATATAALGSAAEMQIPAQQGTLLTILTAAIAPHRVVEVGTFTGYSALSIARGLPADGHLLCLDVSAKWTDIARRYWRDAGVDDRIELRLGPAAESLAALPEEPTFGMAFLDADKVSYRDYYELLVPRMLPNGLIIADNVLQYGLVTDSAATSESVSAVRRFNAHVTADRRVQVVMLPIADGLTIARRLP